MSDPCTDSKPGGQDSVIAVRLDYLRSSTSLLEDAVMAAATRLDPVLEPASMSDPVNEVVDVYSESDIASQLRGIERRIDIATGRLLDTVRRLEV